MDCTSSNQISKLLLEAASLIPISHYFLGISFLFVIFLYNFLECHLLEDFRNGFRGNPVSLTYNSRSEIYEGVASKCPTLHGRYLATPWLSSPHLQTAFLNFFGRPPIFNYRRQLFRTLDGGTIALDWLMPSDVSGYASPTNRTYSGDCTTPIVVVIPGLTSDSSSAYIKHLVFQIAKHGWNAVVSNHRGLGGISVTSDCFYNAGWTEDIREVIEYLHQEYPKAPLFAVGTSIGANVLVKYLGEVGQNTHFAGAAAICSPWDLLIGDRFICRRLVQRLYDRVLTIGLKGYAQQHQPIYSRLADWEGISKSRSVRDFDNYATCLVGKFETVDTYYRRCSSASFVGNVSIPLLCISALDDPVCTREAIPWDECRLNCRSLFSSILQLLVVLFPYNFFLKLTIFFHRANKNIVLATTPHGGHLAFFEGLTANHLWWVQAVEEFLSVLHTSPFMHSRQKQQTQNLGSNFTREPSVDQGPYISFTGDGMVAAMGNEKTSDLVENLRQKQNIPQSGTQSEIEFDTREPSDQNCETQTGFVGGSEKSSKEAKNSDQDVKNPHDMVATVKRSMYQLSRQNKISMWLLAYIAIITTCPLLGSAIFLGFKRKFRNILQGAWPGR